MFSHFHTKYSRKIGICGISFTSQDLQFRRSTGLNKLRQRFSRRRQFSLQLGEVSLFPSNELRPLSGRWELNHRRRLNTRRLRHIFRSRTSFFSWGSTSFVFYFLGTSWTFDNLIQWWIKAACFIRCIIRLRTVLVTSDISYLSSMKTRCPTFFSSDTYRQKKKPS